MTRTVSRLLTTTTLLLWLAVSIMMPASLSAQSSTDAAESFLSFELSAQLLVVDRQAAADELVQWVEDAGGYFVERSLEAVVLRIPTARFSEFRQVASATAERVVTYNPAARDVRRELARTEAAIVGREENLQRVLEFLAGADVAGTLALEREIGSLMGEIESFRGRARALRNDVAYAFAIVAFTTEAATIPETPPSSFEWINGVDMYSFLREAGL